MLVSNFPITVIFNEYHRRSGFLLNRVGVGLETVVQNKRRDRSVVENIDLQVICLHCERGYGHQAIVLAFACSLRIESSGIF